MEEQVTHSSNNNDHKVDDSAMASHHEGATILMDSEDRVKKKRGRPSKHDHANGNCMQLTTTSSSSIKRSRGRPRGSTCNVAEAAGGSFTPYVITVNTGEDVVSRILAFFQKGPWAVCILSATGAVSSVLIRKSGSSTDTLRREGCFEVVSLSGSYTFVADGDAHHKKGTLSVSLAEPDGRVFGGVLEGSLIAAGPIQLIVASFKQNISKEIMRRHSAGPSAAAPNMSTSNPDLERVPLKVPNTIEGERNCSSLTSGLVPTNNILPDNVIPAMTTIGVVSGNVIPANQINMNSAPVNGVGVDSQAMQPITDQSIAADDNADV